jgi:hypothetical protein
VGGTSSSLTSVQEVVVIPGGGVVVLPSISAVGLVRVGGGGRGPTLVLLPLQLHRERPAHPPKEERRDHSGQLGWVWAKDLETQRTLARKRVFVDLHELPNSLRDQLNEGVLSRFHWDPVNPDPDRRE